MSVAGLARQGIEGVLRCMGVRMIDVGATDSAIQPFLPTKEMSAAAKRDGLSVRDYLDRVWQRTAGDGSGGAVTAGHRVLG